MSKILISEWLNHPRRLSVDEQRLISDLLMQYPYLLPARWMHLSQQVQDRVFTPDQKLDAIIAGGNWLMLDNCLIQMTQDSTSANATNEPTTIIAKLGDDAILVTEPKEAEQTQKIEVESSSDELEDLVAPLFTEDYFQHQGIEVPNELEYNSEISSVEEEEAKSLMVMMSFEDWLLFLKKKNEAKKSEEEDKAMLRAMWQREKLAAALEEEEDNIPEAVFEMAINSIDREEIMVSEPLAEIHAKQGRFDKAIEIYRKLSLQNPEKKTYFAAKIEQLNKEKLS